MLANDSVTVAIEIPIWLTETDISALEAQHGIEIAPRVGAAQRAITGHIDFLQVRNGCGARPRLQARCTHQHTDRPARDLRACTDARVPGLKLFDIKCAWFNEQEYCEMFPRTLFAR